MSNNIGGKVVVITGSSFLPQKEDAKIGATQQQLTAGSMETIDVARAESHLRGNSLGSLTRV